jgi:hypothetical protein
MTYPPGEYPPCLAALLRSTMDDAERCFGRAGGGLDKERPRLSSPQSDAALRLSARMNDRRLSLRFSSP